jgi:AAA+ superfamily predicted ATPase
MDYSSEVLKIVEGALKSDKLKVTSYTKLLIEKLMQNNEERLANSFIKLITNNSMSTMQMAAGNFAKIPIDQESRLPMADIISPSQVLDTLVVLNKNANEQVDKFLTYYVNSNKLVNSGIQVPNTILIYGPPGCGKTKLASYLCAKTDLPLVLARLDGMISSYLGSTAKNIRAIFEYAQAVPCILFLDEFDAIAKVRDDRNELGELKRVVNSLLQNIDNLKNGSIIVAATNHDHLLDPAVWRRFGFRIFVDKPDFQSRINLLSIFLPESSLSDKDKEVVSAAINGFSGADIEEICKKTYIDSILSGKVVTLQLIFENVFDFLNFGKDIVYDEKSIKKINYARAQYLRVIDSKVFSYSQIASLLGMSKSYVSELLKSEEGKPDG